MAKVTIPGNPELYNLGITCKGDKGQWCYGFCVTGQGIVVPINNGATSITIVRAKVLNLTDGQWHDLTGGTVNGSHGLQRYLNFDLPSGYSGIVLCDIQINAS